MIVIDGESLKIRDVVSVARNYAKVKLSRQAERKIATSRKLVENVIEKGLKVYGINTGFGEFCNISIPKKSIVKLQENLLSSHATGVGSFLPIEIARAILLLRANTLAKGYSGVRLEVVETLLRMLNFKVTPCIPEKGSVGASGDLAPLAHMALTLVGNGECFFRDKKLNAEKAFKLARIKKLKLRAKEGLALINGTTVMTAIASLAVYDSENLLKHAEIASAMSLEALKGTDRAFDVKIMKSRPHNGQTKVASNLRRLLWKSEIILSHRECEKVQDPYTLRCIPQVLGVTYDVLSWIARIVETELNSATDNPLVFEDEILSAGNFHGQYIALGMDFLALALAEIGSFAERRIARLLDKKLSGLPAFLTTRGGLNSGLMGIQYTAAALVSENKALLHPASSDSIPTCANQEDHVSMGSIAARKALQILKNVEYIIAIELLTAAQALEFHKPLSPGLGVKEAYKVIRKYLEKLEEDRVLSQDIERVVALIRRGEILESVENIIGKLT